MEETQFCSHRWLGEASIMVSKWFSNDYICALGTSIWTPHNLLNSEYTEVFCCGTSALRADSFLEGISMFAEGLEPEI